MLQRKNRLRKRKDINHVHKTGRSFFTKHLTIKSAPNELDHSRVAVIVSSKVHKSAVKRNRLRRVIHGRLKDVSLKPGFDIIIITSPQCFDKESNVLKRKDVVNSLEFALEKSKLG